MQKNILVDEIKTAQEMGIDYDSEIPTEAKENIKKEMRLVTEPKKKYSEFIPDSGILRDYFDYACPLTDAPEIWHVITGVAMLGAVLKNSTYIQFGPQRIYPNLWLILLAPTSFYRKSTVLTIARNILGRFKTNENLSLVYPNETTPEMMVSILQSQPQGIFVWPEFTGILQSFERNYNAGQKELFTELFDSPEEYSRKIKTQSWTIKDPSISIISASAFSWFNEKVREGDIRGGFLARFLYVPAIEKTKRLAIPPEPDNSLVNRIVKNIASVQSTDCRKIDISKIREQYTEWIYRHEDELGYEDNADLLSGFYSRLSIYCLKFAMIIHMSQQPDSLQISENSLERAINITTWLKSNIKQLLSTEFSFSKGMANKKRIFKSIQKSNGIEYRRLLQNSNMLADELRPVLDTLKQEGLIDRTTGYIKLVNVSNVSNH